MAALKNSHNLYFKGTSISLLCVIGINTSHCPLSLLFGFTSMESLECSTTGLVNCIPEELDLSDMLFGI